MNEVGHGEGQLEELTNSLAAGFAIADAVNWHVEYANRRFDEWFPAPPDDVSLASRLVGLDVDRARRKMDKGRLYVFESELKTGARTTALRTTLRQTELRGRRVVLAEAADSTKLKKQEYMLDSFAQLADRNKNQLEKANQALSRKTKELKQAYDVIKGQKDRMERELEVARQLQMKMLPNDFVPNHTECTVAGSLKPALEVGGDFFDFFYVDKDRLCFLVGDVSGKGAAAGLFMAAAMTVIKVYAVSAESTAGIVARVNHELSINNRSSMFVTLFLAILDLRTGRVLLTNAGHNRPYRVRGGQDPELIPDQNGLILGINEAAEYTEGAIVLEPDDLVIVYTDGVTEAMNREGEMFGEGRLEAFLTLEDVTTAESAVRSITDAVTAFEDGARQSDDVTVIAIKFHGS